MNDFIEISTKIQRAVMAKPYSQKRIEEAIHACLFASVSLYRANFDLSYDDEYVGKVVTRLMEVLQSSIDHDTN